MTNSKPTYSVVVPVYNSGAQLRDLVERLAAVFENEVKESYEILLVDDSSTNLDTKDLLKDLAKLLHVCVITLTRNFGKPGAVIAGMSKSRGDWVVTIDDDLQQLPEDIPKLIVHRDHDMVTATHLKKKHSGPFRFVSSGIKGWFDRNLLGYKTPFSPLKLIHRPAVDGMLSIKTNRPFIPALIRQVTDDIIAVEATHEKTAYKKSRYTFKRRWSQFSDLLFGNSAFMMRVFTWIGLAFASLAFFLAGVILWRKLFGHPIQPGWASLMVTTLLVGGVNLLAIGIGGQYFIRILDVSSSKPAFIIRDIKGAEIEVSKSK